MVALAGGDCDLLHERPDAGSRFGEFCLDGFELPPLFPRYPVHLLIDQPHEVADVVPRPFSALLGLIVFGRFALSIRYPPRRLVRK